MYTSAHGVPRAASVHGSTKSSFPGGQSDGDPISSLSCEHLDEKHFLVSIYCA